MADGTHWEWRAFGELSDAMIIQLSALNKHYGRGDIGLAHTDAYLWARDCTANVKLRENSLKFKRLLRADDRFELWTEERDETFDFPLNEEAIGFLGQQMAVQVPPDSGLWANSQRNLVQALESFEPPIHLISVQKFRVQYDLPLAGETLIIELAEIHRPTHTWSIGLEGEDVRDQDTGEIDEEQAKASLANLRDAQDRLQIATFTEDKNYLQMLEMWCEDRLSRNSANTP